MKNDKEIWRNMVGLEGKYMVSSVGRVKNLSRPVPTMDTTRIIQERILSPGLASNGYWTVNIERISRLVHRLVAEAFIPNPNKYPQVNHINSVRTDNRVENLEWVSCRENTTHCKKRDLPAGIYIARSGKYFVQVHVNGKNKHVASCSSIEEAIEKRDAAMNAFQIINKYHHEEF